MQCGYSRVGYRHSPLPPSPPPTRYLNGALLHPETDDRLCAWLTPDGVASLEISDVGLQDGGEYTCTARNMHGRASCTADLHVREGAIEPRSGPPTFLTGLRGDEELRVFGREGYGADILKCLSW